METIRQKDGQRPPMRSKSAQSGGKTIASWERVDDDGSQQKEPSKKVLRVVRRQFEGGEMRQGSSQHSGLSGRAVTALGFEGGVQDITASKRQSSMSTKSSLQDLKRSTLWSQGLSSRNCISALGDKPSITKATRQSSFESSYSFEEEKSDELDLTEKLKAFQNLINPKSRFICHDVSNEELKRARSFSEGVDQMGTYVKFNAESTKRPDATLNEFQMTYEQDKEMNRRNKYKDSGKAATFYELHGTHHCDSLGSRSGVAHRDKPLTENQHPEGNHIDSHQRSQGLTHSRTSTSGKMEPRRVIKRPPGERNKTADRTSLRQDSDSVSPNYDDNMDSASQDDKEIVRYGRKAMFSGDAASPHELMARERYDLRHNHTVSPDGPQRRHMEARGEVEGPSAPSQRVETLSLAGSRPRFTATVGHARSGVFHNERAYAERSQSTTPTFGRIYSDVGPFRTQVRSPQLQSGNISRQDASLKAHLNILGASLSSLTSRLTSGSEGDGQSLLSDGGWSGSTLSRGVKGERSDDFVISRNRRGRENGNFNSDVVNAGVAGRDRHSLETWGSVNGLGTDQSYDNIRSYTMDKDESLSHVKRPSKNSIRDKNRRVFSSSLPLSYDAVDNGSKDSSSGEDASSLANTSASSYQCSSSRSRQTNVQGYEEERSFVDHRSSSQNLASSHRHHDQFSNEDENVSSSESQSIQDLKRTAGYISEYRQVTNTRTHEDYTAVSTTCRTSDQKVSVRTRHQNLGNTNSRRSVTGIDTPLGGTDRKSWEDGDLNGNCRPRSGDILRSKKLSVERKDPEEATRPQKSESARLISRKIPLTSPLRAVHPRGSPGAGESARGESRPSDTQRERGHNLKMDGRRVSEKQTTENQHSGEGNPEDKHMSGSKESLSVSRQKRKVLAKRDTNSSRPVRVGGREDTPTKDGFNLHGPHGPHEPNGHSNRSKSAQGLRSPLSYSQSSLSLDQKARPHSSTGNKISPNQKPHRSQKVLENSIKKNQSNGPASESSFLLNKVQNLHLEIDQRLRSEDNLGHRARAFDTGDTSSSEEDSSTKGAQTERSVSENNSTLTKTSTIIIATENTSPKLSKTFKTSTPVKVITKGRKKLDENISIKNFDQSDMDWSSSSISKKSKNDSASGSKYDSRNYLSNNLRKIIAERNRMTPDFMLMSRTSRKVRTDEDEEPFNNDSDHDVDDDDNDDDDDRNINHDARNRMSHHTRPNSVDSRMFGSRTKNKGDVVSSLLHKMSTGSQPSPGVPLQAHASPGAHFKGLSLNGRSSPVEALLDHLDNPTMVTLLQKLYKADPETRQRIMLKVQVFKAWQHFAVTTREQRRRKVSLLNMAEQFLRQRLLVCHFSVWESLATHSINDRRARTLYRTHMLAKGFKALQWSASRSKHHSEKLQATVQCIRLKVAYNKWKLKATVRRRERIENAFHRWSRHVIECQKVRHMQNVMSAHVLDDALSTWRALHTKRRKHNTAFAYFRRTVLNHSLSTWRGFVALCKEKNEQCVSAVSKYQSTLLRRSFCVMVISFKKSRRARAHFRFQRVYETFWAWRQIVPVCRSERQEELRASQDHWTQQRLRHTFVTWRERLVVCRAQTRAHGRLCRNAFTVWLQAWGVAVQLREAAEAQMARTSMHRALLTWKHNVTRLRRRQAQAVGLLESCHARHSLRAWWWFTADRIAMREKAHDHRLMYDRKTLTSCLIVWLSAYTDRVEQENARRLRSERCARRAAVLWRHKCHITCLERLLHSSQPDREHRLLRAMFTHWVTSLARSNHEKDEAEDKRKILETCALRRRFHVWQAAMHKALVIKPLVKRREGRQMAECWSNWANYMRTRSRCRHSQAAFQNQQLQKAFSAWRRQYQACQVATHVRATFLKGLLLRTLEEWRFFISRKQTSRQFRSGQLVKRTFLYWRQKGLNQQASRTMREEELEHDLELKQRHFVLWLKNVMAQRYHTDQVVSALIQRQASARCHKAFVTWRRHMHNTLIARAYEESQRQRLVVTLFLEWADVASSSVTAAVLKFSERIGLGGGDECCDVDRWTRHSDSPALTGDGWSQDQPDFSPGPEFEEESENNFLASSLCSSLSLRSSSIRLFNGEDTIQSEGETERLQLLSGGLRAAVDSHQARCMRLKETAERAIRRLQTWPLCAAFQQWRDFRSRQSQLRVTSARIKDAHVAMELTLAFRKWHSRYVSERKSRKHWSYQVLSACVDSLRLYKDHRKGIKAMNTLAQRHCMMTAFNKHFPLWHQKAQDLRRKNNILHLWSSTTEREMELLPLENQLILTLNRKSLLLHFNVWQLKYRAMARIRGTYHESLLVWVFKAWRQWAAERHQLTTESQEFQRKRRIRLAFNRWHLRYHQSQTTEMLYVQAWDSYTVYIMRQWSTWAKVNRRLRHCRELCERERSRRAVTLTFCTWRRLALQAQTVHTRHIKQQLLSVFREWRLVARQSSSEKHRVLAAQVHSYTLLVRRLFYHWRTAYRDRQHAEQVRVHRAKQSALAVARVWRKKAQVTRGKVWQALLDRRKSHASLQQWRASLVTVQAMYVKADHWLAQTRVQLLRRSVKTWRARLVADQAERMHSHRLVLTLWTEWRTHARVSRERARRGVALRKALLERSLHVYFQYWNTLTRNTQSVQHSQETRLQARVLRAWHYHTRTMRYLRGVRDHVTHRVNSRILQGAFQSWRGRAEYCEGLSLLADRVEGDRQRATMLAVMALWRGRLDSIMADRFYERLLMVRGARQWAHFVTRRKAERQTDQENWDRAVRCHQARVRKLVMDALRREVLVSRLAQKRRQRLCDRTALVWKARVDLRVTALAQEREFVLKRAWHTWRVELARRSALTLVSSQHLQPSLPKIFDAWRRCCSTKVLPRSPSRQKADGRASSPRVTLPSSSTSLLPVPITAIPRSSAPS